MDIVELCHVIYAKGMVGGSGGNVSIRDGDRILITASGVSLRDVSQDNLSHLSMSGELLQGPPQSKEWQMHIECYRRETVQAVVHVHSMYSVAIACQSDLDRACTMPVYTPGYSVRVGPLPAVPYLRPGSRELADAVGAVIAERDSVLLANHGVLATGTTPAAAFNLVEEIEENAHLHFILAGNGTALSEAQRTALVGRY